MPGGDDGQTLLTCAAPATADVNRVAARESVLPTTTVDVPHDGLPYVAIALVSSAPADQEKQCPPRWRGDGFMTPIAATPSSWLFQAAPSIADVAASTAACAHRGR